MITNALKIWGAILIAVLSVYFINYIYLNLMMNGFMYLFTYIDKINSDYSIITILRIYVQFVFVTCFLLTMCTSIVSIIVYIANGLIRVNKFIVAPITLFLSYKAISVFYIVFIGFAHSLANSLGYSFIFYTWAIITFLTIIGIYIGGIIGGIKQWWKE